MASWCLVLMAVPYEDVLILLRTVAVHTTTVQNKPPPAPPDVQITGRRHSSSSSSGGGGGGPCLPDLLQSVPRLVVSGDGGTAAGAHSPSVPLPAPLRSHCSIEAQRPPAPGCRPRPELVTRCGAQLRRVADELHSCRQTHTPDSVWRQPELRLGLQHLLWSSIAAHVVYTAVRVAT